ncbi:hypothetical protein [Rhodopila sp.]|uniref:hypothetical protein n=1 Tax=Rhodopila sp. TaxID=2480087 RepID=UPI002D7E2C4C|nr:hypothetical protein [Rhodopila sp.]
MGWNFEKDRHTIRLDVTEVYIDALEPPSRPVSLLESLNGISNTFDQWLTVERSRFELRWQSIFEEALSNLVDRAAPPTERAEAARRLLNFVPTHGPALRQLMTAFVEMEDASEAVREYQQYQRRAATLKLPVSQKTIALYKAICHDLRKPSEQTETAQRTYASAMPFVVENNTPFSATSDEMLRPSLSVLPFRNLSGESRHEYVVEGLVEDLTEMLSRLPDLLVVSRRSAAAFKDKDRSPQEIGDALGVRYFISGSVRVVDHAVRLTVELVDTQTGAALWRDRRDAELTHLLEVQSLLAEGVARTVAPHLRRAEIARSMIKRPEDQDAYDLFLRGQGAMHNSSRAVFETAGALFETAIARQPNYAAALSWLSHWHVMRVGQGWSDDPAHDAELAERLARQALEANPTESMAFGVRGHMAAYLHHDFNLAFAHFETALHLNPNSGRTWMWNAIAHAWMGDGTVAVEKIKRAVSLSPYDPLSYLYSGAAGMAYLADCQYERAIEFGLRARYQNEGYTTAYKILILSLVLSERTVEARSVLDQLLKLEPEFTVKGFRIQSPTSAGAFGDLYCDALVRIGAPL